MFASSIPEIIELVGSGSKYGGELKREHGKRYIKWEQKRSDKNAKSIHEKLFQSIQPHKKPTEKCLPISSHPNFCIKTKENRPNDLRRLSALDERSSCWLAIVRFDNNNIVESWLYRFADSFCRIEMKLCMTQLISNLNLTSANLLIWLSSFRLEKHEANLW